jgi:hypothetical protein
MKMEDKALCEDGMKNCLDNAMVGDMSFEITLRAGV